MCRMLSFIGATAMALALTAWTLPSSTVTRRVACGPVDERMRGLVAETRALVSKPTLRTLREALKIPMLDSSLVRPVQIDSLCQLAVRTINRERRVPDTTSRTVHLVSIGSVYWADDPTLRAGEYTLSFVLDSTLTTVLSRPGR